MLDLVRTAYVALDLASLIDADGARVRSNANVSRKSRDDPAHDEHKYKNDNLASGGMETQQKKRQHAIEGVEGRQKVGYS